MTRTGTASFSNSNSRGKWTPVNIFMMVAGFVLFFPLGLAVLAYILWGDRWELEKHWNSLKSEFTGSRKPRYGGFSGATGNHAFDEYRKETLARLEEEHRRLKEEEREFAEFVRELRRARDAEEFNSFMNHKNAPKNS